MQSQAVLVNKIFTHILFFSNCYSLQSQEVLEHTVINWHQKHLAEGSSGMLNWLRTDTHMNTCTHTHITKGMIPSRPTSSTEVQVSIFSAKALFFFFFFCRLRSLYPNGVFIPLEFLHFQGWSECHIWFLETVNQP